MPVDEVKQDSTTQANSSHNTCLAPTPIKFERLNILLSKYPYHVARNTLIDGFRSGFRVKYTGPRSPRDAHNLKSVIQNKNIARLKIEKEIELGRVAGPFLKRPFINLIVSPLGLVPKKSAGEFRLIHHLSYPAGSSINDFIGESDSTVQYAKFDVAVNIMRDLGQGALMGKLDIKSAFRLLPMHPDDHDLLGFKFDGKYYYDKCLPMGLSRSCQLFELFSSFLEWLLRQSITPCHVIHFLDDFLLLGSPGTEQCLHAMNCFKSMCEDIGIPLAIEKTEGPVTRLIFLGLELDSDLQVVRVPQDKVLTLRTLISNMLVKNKVTLKQIQQLIGSMQFACRALVPGRAFMRRLIDLTCGVRKQHHFKRLTTGAKSDLNMWIEFLNSYNGVSALLDREWSFYSDIHLYTDASGSLGFAAYFNGKWAQGSWESHFLREREGKNIAFLELFPICVALSIWGDKLNSKKIIMHCDNQGVVHVINKQTAKCPRIMALLRFLVLKCLRCNILLRAEHIPGKLNDISDAISRFQMQRFRKLAPQADKDKTPFPEHLWKL